MRIVLATDSASVRHTLDSIVRAAGHTIATETEPADLVICDAQHPPKHIPSGARLTLVTGNAADDSELACPLRPYQLLQKLTARTVAQPLSLAGGWSLDALARSLTHENTGSLTLTEKESALLKTLIESREPMPRDALLARVWGVAGEIDTHTLETHIYRLRSKLESLNPLPGDIITEGGAYSWRAN